MNLFAVVLMTSLVSAPPPVFTAHTVDGRQVHGTVSAWDAQSLTLTDGEGQRRLPLDQLLWVAPSKGLPTVPTSDTVWVSLTDGSVIAAGSYLAESQSVKVTTSRAGVLDLPAGSVDHVRFHAAASAFDSRWKEILEKESDQDMLVIASGDTLDHLSGIVRAVREQEIDFDLDGDVLPVRRSKVFGIRYYRPNRPEASEPLARLTDADGSTWPVLQVSISESDGKILAETPHGLRVQLPLEAVARIDFAGAGLIYLSDLTADSYHWTPYFDQAASIPALEKLYRPRRNTAFDSSPILLDGVEYERGLALHSRTEMTYHLTEPFERFQAMAGIDDRLRPRGNVQLKILGDHRILFDATIAGTQPSQPIDVSLKGVATLTILVDFGSDLDVGDHLILAEAKLLK